MEAVPRMPMIWLDLKEAGEFAFNAAVKKFVLKNYGENPENYNEELRKLELLRQVRGDPREPPWGLWDGSADTPGLRAVPWLRLSLSCVSQSSLWMTPMIQEPRAAGWGEQGQLLMVVPGSPKSRGF
uniref:Uncharacterized protein n=1 Tax=Malurus cyaneus samueli TaxID=2593467 RepID=A0A8C5UB15_9PASS